MGASDFLDRFERTALAIANPLAYALRNRLRFSRPGYRERRTTPLKDDRALATLSRHALTPLVERCSEATLTSILHGLDLLEQVFSRRRPPPRERLRILDVGAKNAELAPGILSALSPFVEGPSRLELTAIELDAYRVYASLHSRADAARYFLGLCHGLGFSGSQRYLAGDVLDHHEHYDVVTWFLPFLSPAPLLRWGLARRHLRPETMLRHVLARLDPGGILLIVNQEPDEDVRQRALLASVGVRAESFVLRSAFPRLHDEVYAHVVEKSHPVSK